MTNLPCPFPRHNNKPFDLIEKGTLLERRKLHPKRDHIEYQIPLLVRPSLDSQIVEQPLDLNLIEKISICFLLVIGLIPWVLALSVWGF